MRVFLICPVRGVTEAERKQIASYVSELEKSCSVYWPERDTDQNDAVGLRICTDNCRAIRLADEVHIWWNQDSAGSKFDLGMAFAMNKPMRLANGVSPTEHKSFENLLLAVATGDTIGGRGTRTEISPQDAVQTKTGGI